MGDKSTATADAAAAAPGSSEIAAALGIGSTGTTSTNGGNVTVTVPTGAAPVETEGEQGQEPSEQQTTERSIDSLPKWAQDQIRDLRRDDKAYRQKATQYDDLVRSQMTEQQKAVEEAKQVGRTEAQSEFGQRLAAAEIKAALTGVVETPEDVIEDLNLSRYVTEDGEVDQDAVDALRVKYAAMVGKPKARPISHGRTSSTTGTGSSQDQFVDTVSTLFS